MNWIECNLPWAYHNYDDAPKSPDYPNLDDQIRVLFGKTVDEVMFENFGQDSFNSSIWIEFRDIDDEITQEVNILNLSFEEARIEKIRRLELLDNSAVKAVLNYRNHKSLVNEWYNSQPEIVKIEEEHSKKYKVWTDFQKKKSFSGRGLAVSGTLIEVQVDDKVETHLIGTINEQGGVCNDCSAFKNDAIILRYKVVYSQ